MKPVHPGAILREDILKELNLSLTKVAEELHISRKHLSEIINEKARINAEIALRLEHAFGVDAYFWLDLQSKYDIWELRTSKRMVNVNRIAS